MTVGVVAELQGKLALERLPIADPRLSLDPRAPRPRFATADVGVPRAEVVFDGKWHLGAPAKGRVEPPAKSLQQGELRPVADRVAGWVGPEAEIEPKDGEPRAHILDRYAMKRPVLETQQLLVRSARGIRAVPKGEAGRDSGDPVLLAGANEGEARPAPAAVRGSISRSHVRIIPERSSPAVTSPFGPAGGATSEREAIALSDGPAGGPLSGGRAGFGRIQASRPFVGPLAGPRCADRVAR